MGWKSQLSLHMKDVSFTRIYLREVGNCINSKLSPRGYSHCPLDKIQHPLRALANEYMLQVNRVIFKGFVSELHRQKGFSWVLGGEVKHLPILKSEL